MNERRHNKMEARDWWGKLSYAQQATANGLTNVGYELAFVRGDDKDNLAVFKLDDNLITVDRDGDADLMPSIQIR
ncbi:hypothetical protein C2869_08890 [Saccharobesus litoralis]|uniref:Uncharacterized protein n=1 Tax=Saccharobesus litoralis TaxID=2172099 RepID=A0A2S0VQP7_9ALTE|nr:hypothetical protein [Saccharobesus litoralis]AWB66537.1 hypothetical protein C2869_08890 [Saccharobesus litoralis]